MKKLFKKQSIVDTAINLAVGGGANVLMDYAVENIDALKSLGSTTINLVKIGVGVAGGTMIDNKLARAGFDGLAVVGASDLIKSYISPEPASGLSFMGTGRVRPGQRGFKRPVKGTGVVPFMG